MKQEFHDLQTQIGYTFLKPELLKAALSHGSLRSNAKIYAHKRDSFERLEFLGDRVLGLVLSHFIYNRYPKEAEGFLAKRLAYLVCRDRCFEIGQLFNITHYINGLSKDMTGRSRVVSHAVESLIGAIYLDSGLESAQIFILRFWDQYLNEVPLPKKDAKTRLQEWVQKHNKPLPTYQCAAVSGAEHIPVFKISVEVNGYPRIMGEGTNKKQAEQAAADLFLITYGESLG